MDIRNALSGYQLLDLAHNTIGVGRRDDLVTGSVRGVFQPVRHVIQPSSGCFQSLLLLGCQRDIRGSFFSRLALLFRRSDNRLAGRWFSFTIIARFFLLIVTVFWLLLLFFFLRYSVSRRRRRNRRRRRGIGFSLRCGFSGTEVEPLCLTILNVPLWIKNPSPDPFHRRPQRRPSAFE